MPLLNINSNQVSSKDLNVSKERFSDEIVHFSLIKSWFKSINIFNKLFSFDEVTLSSTNDNYINKPFLTFLLLKLLSNLTEAFLGKI